MSGRKTIAGPLQPVRQMWDDTAVGPGIRSGAETLTGSPTTFTDLEILSVILKANEDNAADVIVGGEDDPGGVAFTLPPGGSLSVNVENMDKITFDGTASDVLEWFALLSPERPRGGTNQ